MQAASRADRKGDRRARHPDTGELCRRDLRWYPPRQPADQRPRVCLTGGAAATGHGAPRGATESPPGVVTDRPLKCRPVGRGRGKRPRPVTAIATVRAVLLSEAPSYILSRLRSDQISSKNVQVQICHPNGHFFVWESSIKSRSGPRPVWAANLTFCVGTVSVVVVSREGRVGTVGSVHHNDPDLVVVASRPIPWGSICDQLVGDLAGGRAMGGRPAGRSTGRDWVGRPA
jgi:hypothetical protein